MWECNWNKIKKSDDLIIKYLDTVRTTLNIIDINNDIDDIDEEKY